MNASARDTILLVEDSISMRTLLREIFQSDYHVLEAESGEQALALLGRHCDSVAIILLDLVMSGIDGFQVLEELRETSGLRHIPVVVVTAQGHKENELRALRLGAKDVIVKPFEPEVARQRVNTIVELHRHKWHLEELVAEQSNTLRHSNEVLVDALSSIIEHRSLESGQHVLRIRSFTKILLQEVARSHPQEDLDEAVINTISSASALHDIGKVSIPDAILNKPGRLTAEEFAVIQGHTTAGSDMLERLYGMGNKEYFHFAYNICRYHHERWDGSGYPEGLQGDAIPLCAQVVGVADVYDALTTQRVYKPAYSHEKAVAMILNGDCGAFSPWLTECFKSVSGEFAATAKAYADGGVPTTRSAPPANAAVRSAERLDATQLMLMKYQALLQYIGETVVEFDLDLNLYHMIYNANPDWTPPDINGSFDLFVEHHSTYGVPPEDAERVRAWYRFLSDGFFRQGGARASLSHRIYSPSSDGYLRYEVTALRFAGNFGHRKLLLIWKGTAGQASPRADEHIPPDVLQGFLSSVLRYRNDKPFTLLAGKAFLHRITGYTAQEITERFHDSLLELMPPEDRELVRGQLREQLACGTAVELQYRLLHKNGRPVWILDRGRLVVGADGQESLCCFLTDCTRVAEPQEKVRSLLERNQIAAEQAGNIVFEWDMAEDRLTCSSKWEEQFGYPPLSKDFSKLIAHSGYFHPDDIPMFLQNMENARNGMPSLEAEVRVANRSGRYLWCHIRATTLLDSRGLPTRAVGSITNIDKLKRSFRDLQEQAEQDTLTRLLNKDAIRTQAMGILANAAPDCRCALLFIDLDHFKQVNDQYGHLFGDSVLTRAAAEIRNLFHGKDLIGRIGGDEFMVFMWDVPNQSLVEKCCRQLNKTFRQLFEKELPDCPLSCSIGVSLFPENGTTYQDLFQRADQALYHAKVKGRNRYAFYQPGRLPTQPSLPTIGTRIDSDEQPGMAGKSLVWSTFRRLYEASDMDSAINGILESVGRSMNVSRVYIFENDRPNKGCSNTFEWCNKGVEPEIGKPRYLSYETDIPGYESNFDERGVFYCPDITTLSKPVYNVMSSRGIKSMLQCAIRDNGVFRGYVGFDECFAQRLWTQSEIDLLTFLSEVVALFLLKRRAQAETEEYAQNLSSVLDGQSAFVYVIDPAYRLRFLNSRSSILAPGIRPGMFCYQAIMRRDTPCENCPARNLRKNRVQTCIIDIPPCDLRVQAEASLVRWSGEEACLLICRDVRTTYVERRPPPFAEDFM